uniref:Asparaginase n=1 Tax=Rhodospirillum rubrum (strain ATCC 11170 / ATH 1.1.1 / DSM 467 / LMG 4362 / NCIMB 8255 / S1) TaxID=269796 RepID=UPI0030BA2B5F
HHHHHHENLYFQSMAVSPSPLRIFTAGGTIDKDYRLEENGLVVGDPFVAEVLKTARLAGAVSIVALSRKDSLDFTEADREAIGRAVGQAVEDHILLTHGTDTMVETARYLGGLPELAGKTVVLSGAMVPGRVGGSDAAFNIGFACAAALMLAPGVYIAMHGKVFDPAKTRMNRGLGRFEPIDDQE